MATSCDEATQLRQQREVGPVHSHAFGDDAGGGARTSAAASYANAAAASAAGEQLLAEISWAQPSWEEVLSKTFAHFDADNTGTLSHEQFERCFALVSSDVRLDAQDWQDLCEQLGVDAGVGLPRGPDKFDQCLADLDDRGIRVLHQRLLEIVEGATACTVCGDRPGRIGGAAAVYCDGRQLEKLQAQGCLCERLETRHGDDTLEDGDYAGHRLMDLYHDHAHVVRQLVRELREATKDR